MKTIIPLLLAMLLVLLCACSGASVPTEGTGSGVEETPWPRFDVTAEELMLSIPVAEGQRLEILDAQGALLLFALQEKHLSGDGNYATFTTALAGIYDSTTAEITAQWTPQEAGWYFTGALSRAGTAVFGRIDDYQNAVSSQASVVLFDALRQETLQSFRGTVQVMQHLGEAVLFSYSEADGRFGVRAVTQDVVQDLLGWQTDAAVTKPLGGDLSVCGERFTYAFVDGGQCVLLTADLSGEQSRVTLQSPGEKFDNLCLTPSGLVISLSLGEGTDDAHRELTLFKPNGERLSAKASSPFYRMAFADTLGAGVDHLFHGYLINAEEDRILFRSLFPLLPEGLSALDGEALRLLRGDDSTLYFYYTELQRCLRVSLSATE